MFVIGERVDAVADHVDYLALFNLFALVYAFETDGVQAVLRGDISHSAEGHGLNDCNGRVDGAVIVEILDYPVYKRAKEVTLAELHNLNGSLGFVVYFFA